MEESAGEAPEEIDDVVEQLQEAQPGITQSEEGAE